MRRGVRWTLLGPTVLALAVSVGFADVTSQNHPTLNRMLGEHPDADADRDGILTFAEHDGFWRAFEKEHGPRKQPDGRPAGPISTLLASGEIEICDFDEEHFNKLREWGWKIDGQAFGDEPKKATKLVRQRVGAFSGRYLLSSLFRGDSLTGRVVSPPFRIELSHIEALLSGGQRPRQACVNVLVGDRVVRTATGRDDDLFETVAFDVSELVDEEARIEIVDNARGLWGHINVDRIRQTQQPRATRVIVDAPRGFGEILGSVETRGARRRGAVDVREGKLSVGEESLAFDSVLLAVREREPSVPDDPKKPRAAVRLLNGETWFVDIVGFEKGQVTIKGARTGRRVVPLSGIASLEFQATAGASSEAGGAGAAGMLYRVSGEPIPSKLVWIRDKDIAIDCPLGIVPIPRSLVRSFVVALPEPGHRQEGDEIALTDGTLLRGRAKLENDGLVVEHAVLGSLKLELASIRYLRRSTTDIVWLDQLESSVEERVGPLLPPPAPIVVESVRDGHFRAVRMLPRTVTRYRVPFSAVEKGTLRGRLAPVAGAKADVIVRASAAGRRLWERRVDAGSDPAEVTIDVSGVLELTIEVDFAGRVAFPCGVEWWDAHVLGSSGG